MATNATEIAVTSNRRKAWRKRVSVIGRPEGVPEVLTVGTEGGLCPYALVGDEGPRRAAPRAHNLGPRKQSHGVVSPFLRRYSVQGSMTCSRSDTGTIGLRDGHVQNGTDARGHTT